MDKRLDIQVARMKRWACDKAVDCYKCEYAITQKEVVKRYRCPFDQVIQAIEDKEAGK